MKISENSTVRQNGKGAGVLVIVFSTQEQGI